MAKKRGQLTIGALARETGVGIETVRYYQRRGLLPEPERTYGRIRHYGPDEVARLRFIRTAKGLGFSLDEIAELLQLDDGADCDEAREMAEQKLADVRQKAAVLMRIDQTLTKLVSECQQQKGRIHCPLILSLREGHSGIEAGE